jgi:hypothetical protein
VTDDAKCKYHKDQPIRLIAFDGGKKDDPVTACEACDCMDRWPINKKG